MQRAFTTSCQIVLEAQLYKRKRRNVELEWKKVKLSVFADNRILIVEEPKTTNQKLIKLINRLARSKDL